MYLFLSEIRVTPNSRAIFVTHAEVQPHADTVATSGSAVQTELCRVTNAAAKREVQIHTRGG